MKKKGRFYFSKLTGLHSRVVVSEPGTEHTRFSRKAREMAYIFGDSKEIKKCRKKRKES